MLSLAMIGCAVLLAPANKPAIAQPPVVAPLVAETIAALRASVADAPVYTAEAAEGAAFGSIQNELRAEFLANPRVGEFVDPRGVRFLLPGRRDVLSDGLGSVRSSYRWTFDPHIADKQIVEFFTPTTTASTRTGQDVAGLNEHVRSTPEEMVAQLERGQWPFQYASDQAAYELLVRLACDMLAVAPDTAAERGTGGEVRLVSRRVGVEATFDIARERASRVVLSSPPGGRTEHLFSGELGSAAFPSGHPRVWVRRSYCQGADGEWVLQGQGVQVFDRIEPLSKFDPAMLHWSSVSPRAHRPRTNDIVTPDGLVAEHETKVRRGEISGCRIPLDEPTKP
jgi:hypothetical protein